MSETLERTVLLTNKRGLHARASAKFVKIASQYDAVVSVTRQQETVIADSIMELLMLAAAKGTSLLLRAEGAEAEEALSALEVLVKGRFGEVD